MEVCTAAGNERQEGTRGARCCGVCGPNMSPLDFSENFPLTVDLFWLGAGQENSPTRLFAQVSLQVSLTLFLTACLDAALDLIQIRIWILFWLRLAERLRFLSLSCWVKPIGSPFTIDVKLILAELNLKIVYIVQVVCKLLKWWLKLMCKSY